MRIGLTGGIGSGKSVVAAMLADLGAYVIDTDVLAREAVAPGSDALREIARTWPQAVRQGALERAVLADIVFTDPQARQKLGAILHPHIRRLAFEREALAAPGQPVVHVVPLLFETGYDKVVDKTVLVAASEAQRLARVTTRDAVDEARVRARMAAQIDPAEARARADLVIENDGDLGRLRERVKTAYERLTASP